MCELPVRQGRVEGAAAADECCSSERTVHRREESSLKPGLDSEELSSNKIEKQPDNVISGSEAVVAPSLRAVALLYPHLQWGSMQGLRFCSL